MFFIGFDPPILTNTGAAANTAMKYSPIIWYEWRENRAGKKLMAVISSV